MEKDRTICDLCGEKIKVTYKVGGTGYAVDNQDRTICYECCGKQDAELLRNGEKPLLYLSHTKADLWEVTNWPGSFRIPVHKIGTMKLFGFGGYYKVNTVSFCFEGTWYTGHDGKNDQVLRYHKVRR